MHRIQCDNCGSVDFKFLFPGRDRLHGFEGEFSVEMCTQCGLIAVHPKLSQDQVQMYYPTDYISYPIAIDDEKSWVKRIDRKYGIKRRCRFIIKQAKNAGRILDIGCATGNFLNEMQHYGWECFGIEPSKYAADYAKTRFNLQVINGYLIDNLYPNDFFDVVTLWDVLEHLPDPKDDLNLINKILKPGGLLVITTPNADAWERKIFGENWVGWDVPRHYHIFSPTTIKDMLDKSSFETRKISSFTGRHGAFIISLQFFLSDKQLPLKTKHLILFILRSLPFRMMSYPFFLFAEKSNHSSIMTVVANKPMKKF